MGIIFTLPVNISSIFYWFHSRRNTGATLLSGASVQDIGTRATASLNRMNQFFSFHMIDSYGCDYSTSGISPDNLQTKVKAFFDRRTGDGPKFDTYILYFSGDTYDTGDWALTGTILLLHPPSLPPSTPTSGLYKYTVELIHVHMKCLL